MRSEILKYPTDFPRSQPHPLLRGAGLSSGQATKIAGIARIDRFAPGDYLFHAGEPVQALFNIADGVAKLITSPAHHRASILGFAFSHDIIGQLSPPRHAHTAQAITALTAYRLPHDQLELLLRADQRLHQRLLNQFCADLRLSQTALMARRAPPAQRLAAFLMCLHQRNPDPNDPMRLIIPMHRPDIADFLGLSLTNLRDLLQHFHNNDLIDRLSARRLLILDHHALADLANPSIRPLTKKDQTHD